LVDSLVRNDSINHVTGICIVAVIVLKNGFNVSKLPCLKHNMTDILWFDVFHNLIMTKRPNSDIDQGQVVEWGETYL